MTTKEEFEKRFVPLILNGIRAGQYDWEKEDLESWEWFKFQIKQACDKQKEICANNYRFNPEIDWKVLSDSILNAPYPEGVE